MKTFKFSAVLAIFLSSFAAPSHAQQQVMLGNATAELAGPWKFHIGDNMAWAQPGFDDSAWGTMDLTPPPGSVDPNSDGNGFVPGWTARGYKGYSGYAWYRLRVNIVQENASNASQVANRRLAILMPDEFDDAYQLYINGRLAGEFGKFTSHGVGYHYNRPRAFPLPAAVRSGPTTIAIRIRMDPATPLLQQDAGGLHGPPVVGRTRIIDDLLRLRRYAGYLAGASGFLELAIQPLAVLIAFWLFALDRSELAYLWLGINCSISLIFVVFFLLANYTTWIPATSFVFVLFAVAGPIQTGVWVIFWSYWFRLERTVAMARLYRSTGALVLLYATGQAMLGAPLYGSIVPLHTIVWLSPLNQIFKLLLGVILVWVTYHGIRRNRTEGWLALTAVVLVIVSQYWQQMVVLHVPSYFWFFGARIPLAQIGTVPSLAIITVLMLRRFLRGQREREQWKIEIEQARQLQQVLIPEALPVVPGFTLESEYRPAQQVGGDFFQIIQHPPVNTEVAASVLIVLGDVTGHGLEAAMLVSLLVGAIRSTAETDFDPLHMLQSLNRRLLGRRGAQATCVALRLAADGAITLANAGHLPPYLNGKEVAMEGAVPLGLIAAAEFSVMEFQLQPGDRLTLLTDGVVEAQNEKKELFGFARTAALVQASKPAADIATAAQTFGQQDDITVVSVVRLGPAAIAVA